MTQPRWSPEELAVALRLPPPTPEQAAVIGAPPGPAVVVAGAGSGKTETMSARVVWLVANELVRPDQVLGLTFTTKAAGELGGRIRARLSQLRSFLGGGAGNTVGDPALAGEPTVATYHAYAGRLVAEHALRLGVEPSVRLLTEAMTWQLAQKVVRTYDLDVPELDNAESTVTNWVLDLSGELAEHLVEPGELQAWTEYLAAAIEEKPRRSSTGRGVAGEPYAEVRRLLERARARAALLPLIERYRREKQRAQAIDYGDQVAIAARVASRFGEVGRAERARYGVVLLDEYQDTGHAQLTLLRALYATGHPVTAVGDPCQSIYGWRGASAANLRRFAAHFRTDAGEPAPVLPLSVSFRNDEQVLDVANALSDDLRAHDIDVGVLSPHPRSEPGQVRCALLPTVLDEAQWVAAQVADVWGRTPGLTMAVLCRRRSQFDLIARAIRARGIPVELVGLGGLLATPEVRDLVSTLQVVADPSAGAALARLLTGARWRVGPRDVQALGRRARSLAARRDPTRRELRPSPAQPGPTPAAVADTVADASLVEALDDLGPAEAYSPEGFRRMSLLGAELAALRRRTAQPLPDLVADVERTLLLDVEVAAAPDRDTAAGRAHLDRFAEVAADFSVDAEVPTLGAFLAYLAAAEDAERGLEAGLVEVEADRVQVLTVHAAKGLEWDVVAVPGLTAGVFPDREAAGTSGWATSTPTLPYALRGDGDDLPTLDVETPRDQKGLEEARRAFVEACRERGQREERRLAYVAVTRARRRLLASGYWWDTATRARGPSVFLEELRSVRGVRVEEWEPPPPDGAENPMPPPDPVPWPVDPLGARRPLVEEGAALVRAAMGAGPADDDGTLFAEEDLLALGWEREAELLLAERARRAAGDDRSHDVALPGHLSVTDLVTLARDPGALASRVRRPLPTRPAPLARRGTAFHAWLEERYGQERLLDLDELPGAADAGAAPDEDLALLQERFLASEWADRSPEEVEVAFETLVGGLVVRGRIDAVFADADGGWTVVDWKTGEPPRDPTSAAVQLAAYRLAWAELAGAPLDRVRAAFHYVRHDSTVAPVDLLDAEGLRALVTGIPVG